MTLDLILALIAFALVSSITPGPNNLMLMASGANFGLKRTVPHMLGVSIGFVFMVVLVGAGLVQVFDAYPVSYTVLKVVSVAYLLYLAWKIGSNRKPPKGAKTGSKQMTFLQAAAFQWVNPKACLRHTLFLAPSGRCAGRRALARRNRIKTAHHPPDQPVPQTAQQSFLRRRAQTRYPACRPRSPSHSHNRISDGTPVPLWKTPHLP